VSAIAVHPTKPILAIAGQEGYVLLWDYLKREDPFLNNYDMYQKKEENKDGVKTKITVHTLL